MGRIKLMQEEKKSLQIKDKQTSEISSKMSHKLASVHLKIIPLCAFGVILAQEDLGSVVLGQPPQPPCHPQPTQPSRASLHGES